jgi:superfamily II DNA or RNA helicase
MSRLRGFQADVQGHIFAAWQAHAVHNAQHPDKPRRNVLAVMPTGAGKTVLMGDTIRKANLSALVKAHRHELVSQISSALAVERIPHRIIGPDSIRRDCCALQLAEYGQHWVDPNARTAVAGVDTLVRQDMSNDSWARGVGLWAGDEAHHYQQENKWGKCAAMFKHAWGLGVTATPIRADGRGLSADSDGVFNDLVTGPDMRWLIDNGYLTDYRVFTIPTDVDYSSIRVTPSGDLSQPQLRAAVHASGKFVGDVVRNYQLIAPGKLGVMFAVDVESAQEVARAFRAAGVTAEVVSAKTPALRRAQILRDFRARRVMMLVNVDLFGEGFDLPAIEVVIFGRKTESYALFAQQFGRVLRLMLDPSLLAAWDSYTVEQRLAFIASSTKVCGIVIDHVGNVLRHGLPDAPRVWDMARRERRSASVSDAIPLRTCVNPVEVAPGMLCMEPYERFRVSCPHCGYVPEVADRSAPEFVDGDLSELSPDMLDMLRKRAAQIMAAPPLMGGGFGVQYNAGKNHQERMIAHLALRDAIYTYGGWMRDVERLSDREGQRRFFHTFGIDVATAQTLNREDAEKLRGRVEALLSQKNIQRVLP